MTDAAVRPLLFLDVDGTVLPTAGTTRPETLEEWYATWQHPSNPHLAAVVREHGRRLMSLGCDVVWATAWMGDANRVIAPILGLPELPVADLGELPGIDDPVWAEGDETAALSWKTRGLCALAAGRPFVWLDDEVTEVDREWIAAHHPCAALVHRVDSGPGLLDTDLDIVEKWLTSLGEELDVDDEARVTRV